MLRLNVRRDTDRLVRLLFILLMLLGVAVRVWRFGDIPGGINQDEAFAGYEAYSLLHYGVDSSGHSFPVYFTTWGSGMNALGPYLMLPFIALFGPETWAIRLPQLIVACLTLWALFALMRRLAGDRAALLALLLLAVCPWHIYLSRWGLESNLAPGFLIFGLYFFVRGLDDERFLPLSALMYGLSLYAYAVLWTVVPLLLLLQLAYGLYCGRLYISRSLVASAVILLLLAMPLFMFLLVNFGFMEEFRIGPVSIPRLVVLRSNEISLSNIGANAKVLWSLLTDMTCGLPLSYDGNSRLFSVCTLPFFLFGLGVCAVRARLGLVRREPDAGGFILIQLVGALLLGLLTQTNETRLNCAYIPMLMAAALGLDRACSLSRSRVVPAVLAGAYLLHFGAFAAFYFGRYQEVSAWGFSAGLEEALDLAQEAEGTIYLDSAIYYSDVLFYTAEPVDEYIETVEYSNYPSAFLDVESFGRYVFGFDASEPDLEGTYIFYTGQATAEALQSAGFELSEHGVFTLALPT